MTFFVDGARMSHNIKKWKKPRSVWEKDTEGNFRMGSKTKKKNTKCETMKSWKTLVLNTLKIMRISWALHVRGDQKYE